MKTLFLNPPSFEGYDGGASSRWPATREIESYWYPVWLAYPAGMLEGSRLLDAFRRVAALPGIVIDAPPELSLFAFHLTWPGATRADEDRATNALMEQVTARGRVMVTGCTTHGRYLGRVCILNFRTHQRHVDALVDDFAASIDSIVAAETARSDRS